MEFNDDVGEHLLVHWYYHHNNLGLVNGDGRK